MKRFLVVHFLELALLLAAALALTATMWGTWRVTTNAAAEAEDLSYDGTLRELSVLLHAGGRDRLASLQRVELPVGNRRIAVDQVVFDAQPGLEPAVATGGFLADQAALYNDHTIRQGVIDAPAARARERTGDSNPSLFRSTTRDDGTQALSDQPSPFVLTVRSPFAERTWQEVRTSDWQRSRSAIGFSGEVTLSPEVPDGSRAHLNGNDCTVRNNGARVLLYCESALASDVGAFYDLGFQLPPSRDPLDPPQASTYRPADIWRNGKRHHLTRTGGEATIIRPGDVLDVPRVGPLLLSLAERGTLATTQWINGRYSFRNQRFGTISFFAGAGRSRADAPTTPLVLALDAAFSTDLEREAREFLASQKNGVRRISVVVLDLRSGELRTIAEPGRNSDAEPLLAFEPILVGSVVKPIIASSILARRPELATLSLDYAGSAVQSVAAVPLRSAFANAANGCAGRIDFSDFIRCSSNQYAATLMIQSLRSDGYRPERSSEVPRDVLERSSVASGLAEAFDVDAFGLRTAGRNATLWTDAVRGPAGPRGAGTTAMSPWESRPWLLFPGRSGTPVDWLARYAFGGWENRWTLLGVAEAYARIARGRDIRATIVAVSNPSDIDALPRGLPAHVGTAFGHVRAALRRVAVDGTAAGLAADLTARLPAGLAVLAKTGTLNEETDRFKALAIAIGSPSGGDPAAELSCGLVAVTFFEFGDDARTPLPAVHVEFARTRFARLVGRHWERISGCGAVPRNAQ